MISKLKVETIIKPLKTGTNHPFVVECSDGKRYVMKYRNEQCNGKALFNELVAARLATKLLLPIPSFNVAKLSENLIASNNALNGFNSISGYCFVSEMLSGTTGINPITLNASVNSSDFPGIIAFDQLVMNTDRGRNRGNWFFDSTTKRLMIIDHTNIFRLAQVWDPISILQDMHIPNELISEFDDLSYQYLVEKMIHDKRSFSKINHQIMSLSQNDIQQVLDDIPQDWEISQDEISAIYDFLNFQVNHIDDILRQVQSKFKIHERSF